MFCYYFIELCKYSVFLISLTGQKRVGLRRAAAVGASFLAAVGLLEWLSPCEGFLDLPRYLLLLVFPGLLLRGSLRCRVYLTTVSFSFLSLLNVICRILLSNLFHLTAAYDPPLFYALGFEFCTIWLFLALSLVFFRLIGPREPFAADPPLSYLALAALDLCCSFYVIFVLSRLAENSKELFFFYKSNALDPELALWVICSLCAALLAAMFLTASLFFHVLRHARSYYRELLNMQERYIALQSRYYRQQEQNYQTLRAFRHDWKNHLTVIGQLNREDSRARLSDYLQTLGQSLGETAPHFDCGNPVASALVSHAAQRAGELGIAFSCAGHLPDRVSIDPIDLCAVLGNLLDNALESCRSVGEGGEEQAPAIDLSFLYKNSHVILLLQNSAALSRLAENAPLSSSKRDGAEHGIGMQNVARILEKYDAALRWWAKDFVFYTEIIL